MVKRSGRIGFGLAGLALLASSLPVGGCSSEDERRPGQLMIAVQTDMQIPKDVSRVRVEISVFGTLYHGAWYPVGPSGLKIPATFGVVAGDRKGDPVTIRAIAEGSGGRLRVLREVVTTVPSNRLALLRMPLQWLCDGTVRETGFEQYEGIVCAPGQSCLAGECVDNAIDSESLPDFSPGEVFGGGDGTGGGRCLDTVGCFARGGLVSVDDACTVQYIEPGTDGRGVNVAVVLPPGSDGICGPDACLIPIDQDAAAGWERDGDRIRLPSAICSPERAASYLGVAVTTACETKTAGVPTCGPWSSVETADVTFEAPAPEGTTCAALSGPLVDARAEAARCSPDAPAACTTSVLDQCGCPLWLGGVDSPEGTTLSGLVQEFAAASCVDDTCPAECPPATTGACVQIGTTGEYECAPSNPMPEACMNNMLDGDESDVDCGGASSCLRCSFGAACAQAGDCASNFCGPDRSCACPPDMVSKQDGRFCIDQYEVTAGDYLTWAELQGEAPGPAPCDQNTNYFPSYPNELGEWPVVGVDWCDALTYCLDQGKRLCGGVDGAPAAPAAAADWTQNEWYDMCSRGGQNTYPYRTNPNTFAETTCNVNDVEGVPWAPGTSLECSTTEGVYDLSGNVREWTNSCTATDRCQTRGGSVFSDLTGLGATCATVREEPRLQGFQDVGFRCCSGGTATGMAGTGSGGTGASGGSGGTAGTSGSGGSGGAAGASAGTGGDGGSGGVAGSGGDSGSGGAAGAGNASGSGGTSTGGTGGTAETGGAGGTGNTGGADAGAGTGGLAGALPDGGAGFPAAR